MNLDINQTYCPGGLDYSPCVCSSTVWGETVLCGGMPLTTITQLTKHQQKNIANEIEIFRLIIQYPEQLIPANFLADHRVMKQIYLECESSVQQIKIDQDAFKSSGNFTKAIKINSCDTSGLKFHFLNGFHQLQELLFIMVSYVYLADWFSFPPLLGLKIFVTDFGTGVKEWSQFPYLENGLSEIWLISCGIDDIAIDRILEWLQNSPTKDTLTTLSIQKNAITTIPRQISSFKNLKQLDMSFNPLSPILPFKSFEMAIPHFHVTLLATDINTIETGAFQGFFLTLTAQARDNYRSGTP